MKIGNIQVDHPFILAPLAGITDSTYRRLMKRHGASVVISELISANAIHHTSLKTMDIMEFTEEERPIGIQIFGSEENLLLQAALCAQDKGADFIDINLGCSVPKVVKKGSGAALTHDLKKLTHILETLKKHLQIPLTIKIRLGWNENKQNAQEVTHIAQETGLNWVAIHGRYSEQMYSGLANWNAIAEIKANSTIPIIGNGDITTPEIALQRLQASKVDALMIGRACTVNPFIFQQMLQYYQTGTYNIPTEQDLQNLIQEHKQLMQQEYHPMQILTLGRKYFSWYAAGKKDCRRFRNELFRTQDLEKFWNIVETYFTPKQENNMGK
jgi:nifR3 family TIM-barrel protein